MFSTTCEARNSKTTFNQQSILSNNRASDLYTACPCMLITWVVWRNRMPEVLDPLSCWLLLILVTKIAAEGKAKLNLRKRGRGQRAREVCLYLYPLQSCQPDAYLYRSRRKLDGSWLSSLIYRCLYPKGRSTSTVYW